MKNDRVQKRVSNVTALLEIIENHRGQFCTITNRKRSTNEVRTFNGKFPKATVLRGQEGGMKFDPSKKGLLPFVEVTDVTRDAKGRFTGNTIQPRYVAVESIQKIAYNHYDIVVPMNI